MKELQRKIGTGAAGVPTEAERAALPGDFEKLKLDVAKMEEEIKELKYVIEQINPVAYVTADEIEELIDERIEKRRPKKKK